MGIYSYIFSISHAPRSTAPRIMDNTRISIIYTQTHGWARTACLVFVLSDIASVLFIEKDDVI